MVEPWLGPGAVLLHIGPRKTGTSALQSAQAAVIPELLDAGVTYPVDGRHRRAAKAVLGRIRWGGDVPDDSFWEALVAEVRSRPDRAVVSNEIFASATAEQADRIVADLGQQETSVLMTLRPLEKMLPSLWQQAIKRGRTLTLEAWLERALDEAAADRFRHLNRYDQLAMRWADIVGVDRVAVLVADSSRPDALFRDYESLVGIPQGLLKPERVNRSLTLPEAEVIRAFNQRNDLVDSDPGLFQRWFRTGAFRALVENRTPPADEPKVRLPPWALARAREIQAEITAGIREGGVAIFGDPTTLTGQASVSDAAAPAEATTEAATTIATELLVGLLDSAQVTRAELAAEVVKVKRQRNKARANARRRKRPDTQENRRSLSSIKAGVRRRLPGA
ncbi:MAG: hypothetical protein K0U64_04885 [Actinomycetia bacterium]|nr:hypothetical protein [Actinomycetes bacterium]